MTLPVSSKPPIGIVVEGHGEENCYPTFISRVIDAKGLHIPILRASGCGSVVRHLEQHLTDLTITNSPQHIIVTIDLQDVIKQELFEDCVALCNSLRERANAWLENARHDDRLINHPSSISIVAQINTFENWIIADREGLIQQELLSEDSTSFADSSEIENVGAYLKRYALQPINLKKPPAAKRICSNLNIDHMRAKNRSFDKFCREVANSYQCWIEAI